MKVMNIIMKYLRAYYRVCRLEYLPGEVPAVFTVLFLGAAAFSRFFDLIVIEALAVFLLLYLSGFIINAVTDQEIDKQYGTFKTKIPKSVDLFGERALWLLIGVHVVVSIILSIHISLQMNSTVPIVLVLLGIFLGLGYSAKPFHFKVRGIWHAIALGSSAFFIPFIFLIFVVGNGISLPIFMFILGFTFVHYGMEFGNQAIDYLEDKEHGVKTPPVRWGMINSLIIALNCMLIGIIVEGVSLFYMLLAKEAFTSLSFMMFSTVYVVLMGIIVAGYVIPISGLWRMHKTLQESNSVEEGMPTLRKICNYAKWQASGVLGIAFVSGVIFISAFFTPAVEVLQNPSEVDYIPQTELSIAAEPEVAFYEDDGLVQAKVNVSILNDEIPKESGSIMVVVQSWTAGFKLRDASKTLDSFLEAFEYWNTTVNINAHDEDDTTIRVKLLTDLNLTGHFISRGEEWVIPSKNDIYIHYTTWEPYYDWYYNGTGWLYNKYANVTVTVFNEGSSRTNDTVELVIRSYTSYGLFSDEESIKNNVTLYPGQEWQETRTLNLHEFDIGDPTFDVWLFYEEEYIDHYEIR
jgi:4-hydroxybenzoate polyprenyltransferase